MAPLDPSPPIFEGVDPVGRRVVARSRRRDGHVRDKHSEVVHHRAAVREAIETPTFVARDADHPERENFHRFGALPGFDRHHPKVCVEDGPTDSAGNRSDGEIITAYPTPKLKRREIRIWPSSTTPEPSSRSGR